MLLEIIVTCAIYGTEDIKSHSVLYFSSMYTIVHEKLKNVIKQPKATPSEDKGLRV